jgi:hypothetical protein
MHYMKAMMQRSVMASRRRHKGNMMLMAMMRTRCARKAGGMMLCNGWRSNKERKKKIFRVSPLLVEGQVAWRGERLLFGYPIFGSLLSCRSKTKVIMAICWVLLALVLALESVGAAPMAGGVEIESYSNQVSRDSYEFSWVCLTHQLTALWAHRSCSVCPDIC